MRLSVFALVLSAFAAPAALAQQAREAPATANAAAGERSILERVIHKEVLPNGLEVIVIENHGVPLQLGAHHGMGGALIARVRRPRGASFAAPVAKREHTGHENC